MSYIELIVVLSIFATISSIMMFNYGDFQAKVDIKNLASDIALKIVEAQKLSLSGLLPPVGFSTIPNWKPSYGVYFNLTSPYDNKSFIYFVDLDNLKDYTGGSTCTGECLSKITITKNNSISEIKVFYKDASSAVLNDLTITFSRPDSGAILFSNSAQLSNVSYVQITIVSPKGAIAKIKLYPSGRVQIN